VLTFWDLKTGREQVAVEDIDEHALIFSPTESCFILADGAARSKYGTRKRSNSSKRSKRTASLLMPLRSPPTANTY